MWMLCHTYTGLAPDWWVGCLPNPLTSCPPPCSSCMMAHSTHSVNDPHVFISLRNLPFAAPALSPLAYLIQKNVPTFNALSSDSLFSSHMAIITIANAC